MLSPDRDRERAEMANEERAETVGQVVAPGGVFGEPRDSWGAARNLSRQ
jgi:hypothetical protein